MAGQDAPTIVSAKASLPVIYRLILTVIEPLLATSGVLLAFFNPADYLATMTRGSVSYAPETAFLYTELGGAWLHFAFIEAVVLRAFDDLRLWRVLCVGMLLSDAAYFHSAAQGVGGWGPWLALAEWTASDWLVFWTTAPMTLTKILVVLGVGVRRPVASGARSSRRTQ